MGGAKLFFDYLNSKMQEVVDHEMPNIEKAAKLVAESCLKGGRFYVFGSGHSHMIAEECYIRAGGLALVHGILPPELMLHQSPTKGTQIERMEGYAKMLLEQYHVEEKDTLMVVSNSGRNSLPVEMCMLAKEIGASVIALTSMQHSSNCTSRHKSGKKIYEIADVTIDNCAVKGDAGIKMEGLETWVGPTSDATGVAIAQALTCEVIDQLLQAGMKPPVFTSANVDGGDAINENLYKTYYGYWK